MLRKSFFSFAKFPQYYMKQLLSSSREQVRSSPSNKFHIADMKIYEMSKERISDGVLLL